jgi:hypothetical protein
MARAVLIIAVFALLLFDLVESLREFAFNG